MDTWNRVSNDTWNRESNDTWNRVSNDTWDRVSDLTPYPVPLPLPLPLPTYESYASLDLFKLNGYERSSFMLMMAK